jgi:hypothetical protein
MTGEPARPAPHVRPGDGRITGPEDVRRLLADVNTAGLRRDNTALAIRLVQPAGEVGQTRADLTQVLPADPAIAGLLPWPGGLKRGATVAAVGSTSLLIALLAGAMTGGCFAAVVGMPAFGALAAAEAGVPLERLALIPEPGPDWPTVVAAVIDGVDIVVVATPPGAADRVTRALMHRARRKGAVLIPTTAWAGCDLVLTVTGRQWSGLGHGHGRLRSQELTLRSAGRGRAARSATTTVTMPGRARPGRAGEPAAAHGNDGM